MPYRPSLDYFLELTKWPSISRAAEELHITQQSLSIYLKRLENYYGATLVERQPSLRLTEEGAALRDAAEKIARIYEEVKGRPKYIISKVTDNIQGNVLGAWKK